jgi:hypothetical protein
VRCFFVHLHLFLFMFSISVSNNWSITRLKIGVLDDSGLILISED